MKDNQIIILAIGISIISIILLGIFIETTDAIQVSLYSTKPNNIPKNKLIEFQGTINKMTFNEKTTSIQVCDINCLTVICQNDLKSLNILSEGDFVKVKGVTKSYYQSTIVYAKEILYIS